MELGNQIKKYRNQLNISQEELAEKVYVSRQSISNWECNKNYPDINSLLRLSEIFGITLDMLIKGDIEIMKKEIKAEDRREFGQLSAILAILMGLMIILPIPLVHFWGYVGIAIWVVLVIATFYVAILVEKKKKMFNIQTYKEILAFTEGKQLDEIQAIREEGKRPYQKILLGMLAGGLAVIAAFIMTAILR